MAPANRPRNAAMQLVLARPEVRHQIARFGATPGGGTPAEFKGFVNEEIERWGALIRQSKIQLD